MAYQDKNLACKECGVEFAFTESEQAFYAEKGFQTEPSRCPSCRAARKRETRGGGGGSYGQGPRQPREMFATTCTQCGVDTEVPFKPTAGKPVLCRDCFSASRR